MKAPERVMVLCCIDLRRPDLRRPDLRRPGLRRPGLRRPDLRRPAERIPDASPSDREAARLFERVIAAVTAFCPAVEVVEPGVCAFGARGPARYFGGET